MSVNRHEKVSFLLDLFFTSKIKVFPRHKNKNKFFSKRAVVFYCFVAKVKWGNSF